MNFKLTIEIIDINWNCMMELVRDVGGLVLLLNFCRKVLLMMT